jgi:glycosyltransferase involved in cell wall biosynthesis
MSNMNEIPKDLVSVIIPCHNAERFLSDTLESVLRQSWPQIEVIIVDDGSTDGTGALIESYGTRLQAIHIPVNRGPSAARNLGTRSARGVYLQYLDSDDLLRPQAIEKKVEALTRTGADVAYSDWQKLEENERGEFQRGAIMGRSLEDVHPDPQLALLTDFWCPPAAYLYRRALVDRIGGWNESMRLIEDAQFALQGALRGGKFVHVPEIGADYRIQRKGVSLSQKDKVGFARGVLMNARLAEDWWVGHEGLTPARSAALARVYANCAQNLFWVDRGAFRESVAHLYDVEPGFRFSWPKIAALIAPILRPFREARP